MGAEIVMRPPTFAIPAQAGIDSRDAGGSVPDLRVRIPARAGMTRVFV